MALLRCLPCIKVRQESITDSDFALLDHGHGDEDADETSSSNKIGVRRFTREEINKLRSGCASQGFCYGEYNSLYSVVLPDLTAVAIKSYRGKELRDFKQELKILLSLQHDYIIKLLGYWDDQEEGILVFEHAENGDLRGKLHSIGEAWRHNESRVLSWRTRVKIAYQLAEAIEYLHEKWPQQIIHGDIKPSNVLLDEQLNCKLSNFRVAKVGEEVGSSSSSKGRFVINHPGYTDYHYVSTGIALKGHDIYSLGVIILELITGIEGPWLHNRGRVESQAESMSRASEAVLVKMLDPRLTQDFESEEARAMASISATCLRASPSLRPSASDIVSRFRNTQCFHQH